MKKTPGYKLVTPAERQRLRHELEQMWSTVPPHALAKARELAGVEAGKEHEFSVALVREQEDTCLLNYGAPINLRVGMVDDAVNGQKAKLLNVQLICGERAWQIKDGVYAKRFQSSEHLKTFLASIEKKAAFASPRHCELMMRQCDSQLFPACHGVGVSRLTSLIKSGSLSVNLLAARAIFFRGVVTG
jgi:hypothetical protein